MAIELRTSQGLVAWLEGKRRDWAQVIALRSGLRVLPLIVHAPQVTQLHLAAFRAAMITWSARKWSSLTAGLDYAVAADEAALAAIDAVKALGGNAIAGISTATIAYAAAATAARTAGQAIDQAVAAVDSGADAAAAGRAGGYASMWREVSHDAEYLERGGNASDLLRYPLWDSAMLQGFEAAWQELVEVMLRADPNAWVWREWYDRRRLGADNAFLLQPAEDKALVQRIIELGEDFWDRSLQEVNADLAKWIGVTRAPIRQLASDLDQPVPHAIGLRFDETNQLQHDPSANADRVARDLDAVDRHSECLRQARKLGSACRTEAPSNSTAELIEDCDLFLHALGQSVDTLRPMLVVMRFVALEQSLKAQEAREPDSNIPALPERALRDLRVLVRNAGILISLDRELAETYRAKAGADEFVPVSPFDARRLVNSAKNAGLTDEQIPAIINAEAEQAEDPNADDATERRLARDTGHVIRRLLGRIMTLSNSIFKNSKNIDTVGGWLKAGWQWLAQHRQTISGLFPDRSEIADWIASLLRFIGMGG